MKAGRHEGKMTRLTKERGKDQRGKGRDQKGERKLRGETDTENETTEGRKIELWRNDDLSP